MTTRDELNTVAEFDRVFRVNPDGTVTFPVESVHAPEVYHVDGQGHPHDVEVHGADWQPLHGYTGQHGYNGAVMHASEYLGGRMADDVLASAGVYVVTSVECLPNVRYPHEWSPSGARCTRCNLVGTGDAENDGGCEGHPDYDPAEDMWDDYGPEPDPAGWIMLRRPDHFVVIDRETVTGTTVAPLVIGPYASEVESVAALESGAVDSFVCDTKAQFVHTDVHTDTDPETGGEWVEIEPGDPFYYG